MVFPSKKGFWKMISKGPRGMFHICQGCYYLCLCFNSDLTEASA
jgi:hypothetical protein